MCLTNSTFFDRIRNEYRGDKNFYALAYDQDEVIDAVRLVKMHENDTDGKGPSWQRSPFHQSRLFTKPRGAEISDSW